MTTEKKEELDNLAKLLKVLGHPMRLAMIEELRERDWCVCELAAKLNLNNPTASKHLSLLKSVNIITMERKGTQVVCKLVMPCVIEMIHCANNAIDVENNLQKDKVEENTTLINCKNKCSINN